MRSNTIIFTDKQIDAKRKLLKKLAKEKKIIETKASKLSTEFWNLKAEIEQNDSRKRAKELQGKYFKDDPAFVAKGHYTQGYYKILGYGDRKFTSDIVYELISDSCFEQYDESSFTVRKRSTSPEHFSKNVIEITKEEYSKVKETLIDRVREK